MRQTLSQITTAAVSPERDRTEQHLRPSQNRVRFAHYPVRSDCPRTYGFFVYMQLEVHAERELEEDGYQENVRHDAMNTGEERSAAVCMPEDVSAESQCNACTLDVQCTMSARKV